MKSLKVIYSYSIKITDEPIEIDGVQYSSSARIAFRDINKNLIRKDKFGVVTPDEIYEKINNGEEINLYKCLVQNFSLYDYRLKYDLEPTTRITLNSFNASSAFFEADRLVDFTHCDFEGIETSFRNAHFGSGNLSFYKSRFNTDKVDFIETSYSEGNNIFQYVDFGHGDVSFLNANFINGNISFVNAKFNDGKVSFKHVNFGDGNVSFEYSSFGDGIVSFERCQFSGRNVDFSKTEFGTGKIDFRRCSFGNAEVSFDEVSHHNEKMLFRRARFGDRPVSFKKAELKNSELILDEVELGLGRLIFFDVIAKKISLKSTILSSYVDLRVSEVDIVDISNTIIRDIVDFKKGLSSVEVNQLLFYGLRNLGKLFLSWNENHLLQVIEAQEKTSYAQKAEQFRLLKENFNGLGQYEDEDLAYIYFKRYETKTELHKSRKEPFLKKAASRIGAGFQTVVFDWMGLYATSPGRVLKSILVVFGIFSITYFALTNLGWGNISCFYEEMTNWEELLDSFYFSAVTFFTIGYGECTPTGIFKFIAPFEGWCGVFMMSYFTVAFVRKILR